MADHLRSNGKGCKISAAASPPRDVPGSAVDPRALGFVKATYGVNETLELLSIGRTALYAAVKRGELTPIKFGRKTLFCAADLAAFLSRLIEASSRSSIVP